MTSRVWRALVVDDNPTNLEVAVGLLQQMGLEVDAVSGGEQAVARARSVVYDLIVMDVQMPGMDGIEATRRIRQNSGPVPPIVALTANADASDHSTCLAAGMNDYLTKPVWPHTLRRALQRWVPGWRTPARPQPVGRSDTALPTRQAAAEAEAGAASSASDCATQQRLSAIKGFDLPGSLLNLGGQQHRLERVLLRFAATYRAGEPALMQAARRADTAALWQVCHSLRGACAVLCATALVQQIEALETALQAALPALQGPDTLRDQVLPLQAELVSLACQLEAAMVPKGS